MTPDLIASDVDGTLLDDDEKITARTRDAVHAAVLVGKLKHVVEVVVTRDRLQVEQEIGVEFLVLVVYLVLGGDVLRQRVCRLDHRCDDVAHANLLGLKEVTHRLTAADLDRERQARGARNVDETQQLVVSGDTPQDGATIAWMFRRAA